MLSALFSNRISLAELVTLLFRAKKDISKMSISNKNQPSAET